MTKQEEVLFHKVYLPVFLEKAAQFGLAINTQADLDNALETTAHVKQLLEEQARANNPIKAASASLNQALGLSQVKQAQQQQQVAEQHAGCAVMDPEVQEALLSLGQ